MCYQNKDSYRSHLRTGISHEERELTVDSAASILVMGKCDLNHEERTIRKSKESCKIGTSNGSVATTREAAVHVRDLDVFITVQLSEDSFAVLSLRRLSEEHGYSNEWMERQPPT